MEQARARGGIEFFAQAGNVDIDDVVHGGGPGAHSPNVASEHFAGDDAAVGEGEVGEEIEFAGGEIEVGAAPVGAAGERIDFEIGDAKHGFGARAAEESADAGEEFCEREGLDEVIIGAAFEAAESIVEFAAGGDDEGRDGIAAKLLAAEKIEAVAIGQAEIEDDGVEAGLIEERGGGAERGGGGDGKIILAKALRHAESEARVIFDKKDAGHIRTKSNSARNLTNS